MTSTEELRAAASAPELGERILAAWREGALVPGRGGDAGVRLAGIGEAFAVWRLDPTGASAEDRAPIAIRTPWRRLDDLPQAVGQEIAALRLLTPGIGPRVLKVHANPEMSPIGRFATVLTYVGGSVLAPEDWTRGHLLAHARMLARLHQHAYPGRGLFSAGPDPARDLRRGQFTMTGEIDGAFAWWRENEPVVSAELEPFMARAREVCAAADPACEDVREFVLAHGDLCATNIVWDSAPSTSGASSTSAGPHPSDGPRPFGEPHPSGGPSPRYIDFEWAQADDRARDLAIIGGPVHGGPWYVPFGDDELEAVLAAYVAEARALDPDLELDVDALRIRRDAWVAYERTAMLLHVTRRTAAGDALHRAALPTLHSTLAAYLQLGHPTP